MPIIEDLGVRNYRDLDWCRNLNYARGAFSDNLADPSCNLFDRDAAPFDAAAAADFDRILRSFDRFPSEVLAVDVVTTAEGERVTFSIAAPGEQKWAYVFEPRYELPSAIPDEWVPTPIDRDWYFVWEDAR